MKILNFKKLLNSFKAAFQGLKLVLNEQTFQIMAFIAFLVIFLMIYLKVTFIEKLIIIFLIVITLALEIINTQIEKVLDILEPNYSQKIKMIKDISAAAVFLVSLGALVVGLLIFFPYLKEILFSFGKNLL